MAQILNKLQDVDPNDSDSVKECVTLFFQNLLKQTDSQKWLTALEDTINRFPKFCISHRATIETYICNFLDSSFYFDVVGAAKCAHALQQVRPSQEKTSTPKACWRSQMSLMCHQVHKLIKTLFPQAPSMYRNELKNQIREVFDTPLTSALKNITQVENQDINKQKILLTRLKNVFIFIQAMLVEIFPVAKPIQPQFILDSIVHTLSIAGKGHNKDDIILMKTEALRTLDALVACLGSHLIPYSPLVFRLVMQTLRWSSDNSTEDTKSIRCTAYKSLQQWLNVLHAHKMADRGSLEDELTTHIINDITPPKKTVELTMGPQPTKNMSKKARRKLANTQLKESTISVHMPGEKNKISKSESDANEVANAALECAETLFIVCGIFLKPTTHKLFQERLVKECFSLSSYNDTQSLLLLRVLEACRKCTPNTVPPPTQYCLHLYSTLVNSGHAEIVSFCSRALLDIRLHLHCSPPSLNFALQVSEDKAVDSNKKISKKNREVLESLLGKNRLPPDTDDVITIADEPVNKKPRLSEEQDKISLSSENVSSVEISDDSDSDNVQEISVEVHEPREVDNEEPSENVNIDKTQEPAVEDRPNNETLADITGIEDMESELDKDEQDSNVNKTNEDVNNMPAQVAPNAEKEPENSLKNIYEAPTQLPLNESTDTIDCEEPPHSLEVTYDYPNKGNDKIPILDKIDDNNIPSSNETDDIQITCGQVLQSSQEDIEKKDEKETPKENGIVIENGEKDVNIEVSVTKCNPQKALQKKDTLSVEEMMADFVDEVKDDD